MTKDRGTPRPRPGGTSGATANHPTVHPHTNGGSGYPQAPFDRRDSHTLDLLLDEESLLLDAFAMLRPGLRRLGPAAHVAAVALEHIAQVRIIRRGVEAEVGL